MITHREAEILISARQDAPLDPVVERELQAHLATCDECRAFAIATERLTAGIKSMPSVPVNPRIRREVMEKVNRGRNPLAGIFTGIGGGFQTGPVLAAAAAIVIIGLFGWMALDRMVLNDGDRGDDNQIAAVPTEVPVDVTEVPAETVPPEPTVTSEPEPTSPPELTATNEPEPTAPPEPTATNEPEPTAPPEPTATNEPEPTAPPEPTATNEPEPTAPPEPTATIEPEPTQPVDEGDGPVDLTTLNEPAPTEAPVEPTTVPEPTEIPVEPTTVAEPTEIQVEPTTAPEPTATQEPEPTETPGIEPMDGASVVESVATAEGDTSGDTNLATVEATSEAATATSEADDGTGGTNVPIEPTGDGIATQEPEGDASDTTGQEVATEPVATEEAGLIEPIGDDGEEPVTPGSGDGTIDGEVESTPEDGTGTGGMEGSGDTQSLADVSEGYSGIAGDPSGNLGLVGEGRLEFVAVPDGASMTTSAGYQLQSSDVQPGVVNLCGDEGCAPGMEVPAVEGWQGDIPLGVIGDTSYFMRLYGDRTEIYSAFTDGATMYDAVVIGELGPTSAPAAVYENNGVLFAWLPSGEWLEVSGGSAQVYSGSYTNPTNVRFAPVASQGPLLGYFSEGTLVIAPITSPDAPVFSVPSDGVDFDMTPLADRVAVIRGNDIVIYDISGAEIMVYEGGDMQPGSLIWLNGGIVFVDRNTGNLYQIPETAS